MPSRRLGAGELVDITHASALPKACKLKKKKKAKERGSHSKESIHSNALNETKPYGEWEGGGCPVEAGGPLWGAAGLRDLKAEEPASGL